MEIAESSPEPNGDRRVDRAFWILTSLAVVTFVVLGLLTTTIGAHSVIYCEACGTTLDRTWFLGHKTIKESRSRATDWYYRRFKREHEHRWHGIECGRTRTLGGSSSHTKYGLAGSIMWSDDLGDALTAMEGTGLDLELYELATSPDFRRVRLLKSALDRLGGPSSRDDASTREWWERIRRETEEERP